MTTATKAGGAVLKPCPFCGVVPVIERCADTHDRVYGPRKWWGVHCRSTLNLGGTCAVEIRPQASIEAAVTRWNTRAPAQATIDELRAEVERLRKENVALKDGQQIDARNYLECDAERERLTRERDEALADTKEIRARWNDAENEFAALKAKQIDVEAVMRLADGYADAARWNLVNGEKPVQAAREALRACLLGDGGTL